MIHEISLLATLTLVHLVALASPGPDFALLLHTASNYGRRAGVAVAFGIAMAILLHSLFALTGVALLIQQLPLLGLCLQLAGGAYLLYLGVMALSAVAQRWGQPITEGCSPNTATINARAAVLKGFVTNLLNPKALVFFISLLGSLIPTEMSLTGKGIAIFLLWGLSFGWFALLAYLLTGARMQQRLQRSAILLDALCGTVFCLVGGAILYRLASF